MRGETKAAECSSVLMQDDDYTVYGWTDIDGKNDTDLIDSDAGSNTAIHQKYKRISTEGDSEIVYDVSGYIGKYDAEGHSITVDIENEDPDSFDIKYSLKPDGVYEINGKYVAKFCRDVGVYTVYYRISKRGYKTVRGEEKIIIGDENSIRDVEPFDPVVICPERNALTFDGTEQVLLKPGTVKGGTLKYALGTDEKTVPERGWRRTVPKGNQAGVYHVWFKVEGNDKYNSIPAMHIPVTIAESRPSYRPRPDTSVKEYEEKVSAAKAKKVKIRSFKAKKTLMKLSSKRKTYRIRIRSFTKVKNPITGKYEKIRGKWSAVKKVKA